MGYCGRGKELLGSIEGVKFSNYQFLWLSFLLYSKLIFAIQKFKGQDI